MKIIIDERETVLYEKCQQIYNDNYHNKASDQIKIEHTTLFIGDIFILNDENRHIAIIERKTLSDLLSSLKDGRYNEQCHRLIHSTGIHQHNIIYLIEGGIFSLSFEERKLVYSIITSLNHFKGLTVIKTSNVNESAEFIISFTNKISRNLKKKEYPKYWSSIIGNPNDENIYIKKTICDDNEIINGCNNLQSPFFVTKSITKLTDNNDLNSVELQTNLKETNIIVNNFTGLVETTDVSHNNHSFTSSTELTEQTYVNLVKKEKKNNLTPSNIGAIFLSQIPLISSITANAIMKKYNNSLVELMKDIETNPNCLEGIYTEKDGKKRKLGANVIKNIIVFLQGST
jgi:hypothetical protein